MARSSSSTLSPVGHGDIRWLQFLAALVASFVGVRCGPQVADEDARGDKLLTGNGREETVQAADAPNVDQAQSENQADAGSGKTPQAEGPTRIQKDTPADTICDAVGFPSLVTGLTPSEPVDFMAWYRWEGEGSVPELLQQAGESCADDAETCADVGAPPPGPAFDKSADYTAYEYLVYRRGEQVGYVLNPFELLDFVGTVDTPNEAALLFWGVDRPVACDVVYEQADGSYWAEGDYLVETCPATVQHIELTVSVEGRVEPKIAGEPAVSDTCFY